MNEPYDPSKFTVPLENGERMKVSDLNKYQAEQHICHLLTVIREIQVMQTLETGRLNYLLKNAGIK